MNQAVLQALTGEVSIVDDRENLYLEYYSENAVYDGDNLVSQLLDTSGNSRNSTVATGTARPLYSANELNGFPSIKLNGTTNNIRTNFNLPQPFTEIVIFKPTDRFTNDMMVVGSETGNLHSISNFNSKYRLASGASLFADYVILDLVTFLAAVTNGTNSLIRDNIVTTFGNAGTTYSLSTGVDINLANRLANMGLEEDLYVYRIYSGAKTETQINNILNFLKNKYGLTAQTEIFDEDNLFNNFNYSDTGERNVYASYRFQTSENLIKVKVNPSFYVLAPLGSYISVYINGVYHQRNYIKDNNYIDIILPLGNNKEIEIIDGTQAIVSGVKYRCNVESILCNNATVHTEDTIADKLVVLGDSITLGANGTVTTRDGWVSKFKQIDNKEIAFIGMSGSELKEYAETSDKVNNTVSYIQTLFANVIVNKVLAITLGSNDWATSSTPPATLLTWYGNLLDAIHLADEDIKIYCISPLRRYFEDIINPTYMPGYRTGIETLCADRPTYTVYKNGYALATYPTNMPDYIHPNDTGHIEYYNNVHSDIMSLFT